MSDASGRAQTQVIGVTLLVAVTMLSLGGLMAGIGAVVADEADAASAAAVAGGLERSFAPTAGPTKERLTVGGGTLTVVTREFRVFDGEELLLLAESDALVYAVGRHRVAYSGGAVVRGHGADARFVTRPSLLLAGRTALVGVSNLSILAPESLRTGRDGGLVLSTNASHGRRSLPPGEYRVAIETTTPAVWEAHAARAGFGTARQDFDGDGVESVVLAVPGRRTLVLVVRHVRVEVRRD